MRLAVVLSGGRRSRGVGLRSALVAALAAEHEVTVLATEAVWPLARPLRAAGGRRAPWRPVALTRLHEADAVLHLFGDEPPRQRATVSALALGRPGVVVQVGGPAPADAVLARATGIVAAEAAALGDWEVPTLTLAPPAPGDAAELAAYAAALVAFAAETAELAPLLALCDRVGAALATLPDAEAAAGLASTAAAIDVLMPPRGAAD